MRLSRLQMPGECKDCGRAIPDGGNAVYFGNRGIRCPRCARIKLARERAICGRPSVTAVSERGYALGPPDAS